MSLHVSVLVSLTSITFHVKCKYTHYCSKMPHFCINNLKIINFRVLCFSFSPPCLPFWVCGMEELSSPDKIKATKCRKRDSLKLFLGKIASKATFLKLFSCYEKRLHSPFLPLHRQNKEVWVSGLNQHTANVPNRKVPKVRILLLPHFGSLAQLD